jgi:hypothetical protein
VERLGQPWPLDLKPTLCMPGVIEGGKVLPRIARLVRGFGQSINFDNPSGQEGKCFRGRIHSQRINTGTPQSYDDAGCRYSFMLRHSSRPCGARPCYKGQLLMARCPAATF